MESKENILSQLNESQREAVEYCEGPELVIAGAGSGKTRVLTYKIAYLLESGMKPWEILALTFTNKAAEEMKLRIGKLVGSDLSRYLYMGTFHSIFARILRIEAEQISYKPNFTIYDEADSRSLIKTIIKEKQLDDKIYKPATVHNCISMAKNHLIFTAQYANDGALIERDRQAKMPSISDIYATYQQRLQQANAMDFDDLLTLTFSLFRDHPDILLKYAQKFRYVLVDEYQDTNSTQQQIVFQLTKEHRHVCVVGDDYQSIYGFRGANIDNILDFQKIYEEAKLFKLEQNYRSTQRIVQAANSLMKHNVRQIDKDVFSKNEEGEKLILKPVYSDREEAAVVCKDIKRIKREDHCEYSDFAVLYRTNAQSRSFEEEMRKQSIPYRIYGGLSFYQRKEIKDIIAYFRIVTNPDDEEAIKRIINYPTRGIGDTTVKKISACAQQYGVSFWEVISNPAHYQLSVNKGALDKLTAFRNLISTFIEPSADMDAYQLGQKIIKESGISVDLYSNKDPEGLSRQQNLEELLSGMNDFVESRKEEDRGNEIYLHDYLQEVSLLTDLDSEDDETSKVVLMTIHAAKGLEFSTVFIVGMEENIFPSPMSANSPRELEEERRLLYVAITRAEHHCILTCAKNRFRYGHVEFGTPSRFLQDIDPKYMKVENEDVSGEESQNRWQKRPWEDDYEIDKPYTGSHPWGSEYPQKSSRWQNSRPVAGQFMADAKPKITSPHKAEQAVDPFSESFKRQLAASGGNLKRVKDAVTNGGRKIQENTSATEQHTIAEGDVVEHQRFGIGTVIKVEGVGENERATIEFRNTDKKTLLLKFARIKVISKK